MSLVTIFYLCDIVGKISSFLVCLLIILFFVFLCCGWCAMISFDDSNVVAIRGAITYLKITFVSMFLISLILICIPSKETLYVYGGQEALTKLSENKDAQEITTLLKQITIKELKGFLEEKK